MYSALINEKNNKYMQCIKLSDNALKLACTCFFKSSEIIREWKRGSHGMADCLNYT